VKTENHTSTSQTDGQTDDLLWHRAVRTKVKTPTDLRTP